MLECLSSKAMRSHLLSRKATFGCSVGGWRLRSRGGQFRGDWLQTAPGSWWRPEPQRELAGGGRSPGLDSWMCSGIPACSLYLCVLHTMLCPTSNCLNRENTRKLAGEVVGRDWGAQVRTPCIWCEAGNMGLNCQDGSGSGLMPHVWLKLSREGSEWRETTTKGRTKGQREDES